MAPGGSGAWSGGICGGAEVPAARFQPAGDPHRWRGLHRGRSVVLGSESLRDVHLERLGL